MAKRPSNVAQWITDMGVIVPGQGRHPEPIKRSFQSISTFLDYVTVDDGTGNNDVIDGNKIKNLSVRGGTDKEIALATITNDNIVDATIGPSKLAQRYAQMYPTAAQTISNSTPTQVNMDTFSGVGTFDNGNDTWAPDSNGLWLLVARVSWYGNGSGSNSGSRYVEIRANAGTALANSASKATNEIHHTQECTWIGELTTSDTIDVVAEQNSGTAFTPHLIVNNPHWTGFQAVRLQAYIA